MAKHGGRVEVCAQAIDGIAAVAVARIRALTLAEL